MSFGRILQVLGLLIVGWGLGFGLILHGQPRAEWVELSGMLGGVIVFTAGYQLDKRRR